MFNAFLKVKPNRSEIENFKANLIQLLDTINESESEEFHKNLVSQFLKDTYYKDNHFINTKGRTDLVIHNGKDAKSTVGVVIEAKKPTNKSEMLRKDKVNSKALQELVLYYLRERITLKNLEIKFVVATNIYEWFIFDASIFEKEFAQNKALVKQFTDFEEARLSGTKTDFFYKEIAEPAIENIKNEIDFTYFDIREYGKPLRNDDKKDDNKLIALYKLLSPEHLLKLPFVNDSNSLDKSFYTELLHILGLSETKEGSKKLIGRKPEKERNPGSLIENTMTILQYEDCLGQIKASNYGATKNEQLYSVALELGITWINRILFLKLLEGQLIKYHKGDSSYKFLNIEHIPDYDALNKLFFQVLAIKESERSELVKKKFSKIPYLNSSLFEPNELEHKTIRISNLEDEYNIPIINSTVLKDKTGKRLKSEMNTLEYLFRFLEAYDFASEGSEDIQEDNKRLINASVLGLIFEKINGYKDGSFFTPGFITMYMARETIRRAVVQKFNETKNWDCKDFNELYNKIEDKKEANNIINSLKICDPAVGSGHFLVSALNEIITIKSELKILLDREGKTFRDYHVEVVNDELIITDEDGSFFEYNPNSHESQRVQEALFHEKQTIIENCLFGVDINPNSVKICRLRLWIELLKNAYYRQGTEELETLPNIDINIKCGNSLISRYALDADIKKALKKSKWTIDSYRLAVMTYRNAKSKEEKQSMVLLIDKIKNDFESEIATNDKRVIRLNKLKGELFALTTQTKIFEQTKKEKAEWNKKVNKLTGDIEKLETELEEIRNNKIYENAFEWRFEFPEVLNDEGDFIGFDVLIGNPPYVAVSGIDIEERDYIFNFYQNASSRIDLFALFTEFGKSILKLDGVLTYIIPMQFLKNAAFSLIRKELLITTKLLKVDYVGANIFEDANNDTIVFEYQNNSNIDEHEIEIKLSETQNGELFIKSRFFSKQDLFIKNDYSITLSSNNELVICNKVDGLKDKIISEDFHIIQGIVSGLNEAFIHLDGHERFEPDLLKPYLLGSDFKNYSINSTAKKKILYLNKNIKIENYPKTKEWLLDFKPKLEKRREVKNGSIPWYSLQWPRDEKYFLAPKILFQKIRNQTLRKRLVGTFDEKGFFLGDGVIFMNSKNNNTNELKFVLALLNSELMNFYFRMNFLDVNLKIKYLEITPLPKIDENFKKNIIELVDNILEKKKFDPMINCSEEESKIDKIIFELYSLTKEEIEIVENE